MYYRGRKAGSHCGRGNVSPVELVPVKLVPAKAGNGEPGRLPQMVPDLGIEVTETELQAPTPADAGEKCKTCPIHAAGIQISKCLRALFAFAGEGGMKRGKGDGSLFCKAPFGPFWQKSLGKDSRPLFPFPFPLLFSRARQFSVV